MATRCVISARSSWVTGTPSSSTSPEAASYRRGSRASRLVLPAPVEPMIATVWPGSAVKLMSLSTGASAPG